MLERILLLKTNIVVRQKYRRMRESYSTKRKRRRRKRRR
jgi:hypothetical protein